MSKKVNTGIQSLHFHRKRGLLAFKIVVVKAPFTNALLYKINVCLHPDEALLTRWIFRFGQGFSWVSSMKPGGTIRDPIRIILLP